MDAGGDNQVHLSLVGRFITGYEVPSILSPNTIIAFVH